MSINIKGRYFSGDLYTLFIKIYKGCTELTQKKISRLAFETFFAGCLEIALLITTSFLLFNVTGDGNELPSKLSFIQSKVGINFFNKLQITSLFAFLAIFSSVYNFYLIRKTINTANRASNDITSKLIESFLDMPYSNYLNLSTDRLQTSATYSNSLFKNIWSYLEIIRTLLLSSFILLGVLIATETKGLILFILLLLIYYQITLKSKKSLFVFE